jgi:hypothetical protein
MNKNLSHEEKVAALILFDEYQMKNLIAKLFIFIVRNFPSQNS